MLAVAANQRTCNPPSPEVSSRLVAEGSEVVGSTPEEAMAVVNGQLDQWADIVRRTGIKLH